MYRCSKCGRFLYYGLEHECKPVIVTAREVLAELAEEQGLPKERPDYVALASEIWPTAQDVSEFEQQLRESRRPK